MVIDSSRLESDVRIFGWMVSTLGDSPDDDSLEKFPFFWAIPGLFNSELVEDLETKFPITILKTIWHALDTVWDRTLSSNSVAESVKIRRLNTCGDILSMIPFPFEFLIRRRQSLWLFWSNTSIL